MVSMEKGVFFPPLLKAVFQQLETWLVNSFLPQLSKISLSPQPSKKKTKNRGEHLQCLLILWLKNKNLLFYFIFTDNWSLLVKMDATHLCFSPPFMSGVPWIAKPDKVVHCRVFQLPPSTAPPVLWWAEQRHQWWHLWRELAGRCQSRPAGAPHEH